MDKVEIYLRLVVEQPLLLLPVVFCIIAFLIVPKENRLFLTLVILVPWLTIAQSPDLGPISIAAKVSCALAYFLIALSALVHPGPKRHIPGVVWIFVIVAVVSIFYVLTVQAMESYIIL